MATISWEPMVPSEALVLKDMIKTELKRRSGDFLNLPSRLVNLNGKVSLSFDVDDIRFLINPETNRVIAQCHGETIIEPLLLIKDLGDLNNPIEEEMIPNSFDYAIIKKAIDNYKSEDFMTSASSCRSACTGLCVGMCGISCTSMCNDTCTGCSGECSDGCTSCTGCAGDCGTNCEHHCYGSCSESASGCGGNCSGGCTSCSQGCTSCTGGCSGNCTNGCSDGCAYSCNDTCRSMAVSGNNFSTCNACSSFCDGACGKNCTGTTTGSTGTSTPGSYCTTCGVSCGANCYKSCSGCIGNCVGYCMRACGNNCVGCSGDCSSNSTSSAETNEHTSCTDCDWTCLTNCNITCTGSCIGECVGNCVAVCANITRDITKYWYIEKYVYGKLIEVKQVSLDTTSGVRITAATSGDASDTFEGWSVDPDSVSIAFADPTVYYNYKSADVQKYIDSSTNTLKVYAVFSYSARIVTNEDIYLSAYNGHIISRTFTVAKSSTIGYRSFLTPTTSVNNYCTPLGMTQLFTIDALPSMDPLFHNFDDHDYTEYYGSCEISHNGTALPSHNDSETYASEAVSTDDEISVQGQAPNEGSLEVNIKNCYHYATGLAYRVKR